MSEVPDTIFYTVDQDNYATFVTRTATERENNILNLAIILRDIKIPEKCFARMYYSRHNDLVVCGIEVKYKGYSTRDYASRTILGESNHEYESLNNAFSNLEIILSSLRDKLNKANELFSLC